MGVIAYGPMKRTICGSPYGLLAHQNAGERPCYWCARTDPEFTPPGAVQEGAIRHYLTTSGVIIGSAAPNAGLRRLLAGGAARELTDSELRHHLTERASGGRGPS